MRQPTPAAPRAYPGTWPTRGVPGGGRAAWDDPDQAALARASFLTAADWIEREARACRERGDDEDAG